MIHFKSTRTLDDTERSLIYRWLRDHNVAANRKFVEAMENGASKPLSITACDESGVVVGGLIGETVLEWLRVHMIAVCPANRRTGIGSRLLVEAEKEAKSRGCTFAYLDTMSYQSPGFYSKLGYSEVGKIQNWDSQGHAKHFFTKPL